MKPIQYIFLGMVFILPFLQGLYFYHEVFIAAILILLLLLGVLYSQGEVSIGGDVFVIGLGICSLYFIISLFAIDRGMAILGALKIYFYLLFYILYSSIYTKALREKSLQIVMYSCIVMAILCIVSVFIHPMQEFLFRNNRLGGFFQYANTYAMYCLVGLLLLIRKSKLTFVEYVGSTLVVITLILTFSRSVIVMSIPILIIGLWYRRKNIFQLMFSYGLGILLSIPIIMFFQVGQAARRLHDISLQASEWQTRLLYYQDALSMIGEYPFGTGHLGYYYIQRAYQTGSMYHVKFVHSSLLQILLDIGWLGGLLFILFIIYGMFFHQPLKNFYLKLILLSIIAHSIIDFDFEYGAMVLFIILIMGVYRRKKIHMKKKVTALVVSLHLLLYIYFAVVTFLSFEGNHALASRYYPFYTVAKVKLLNQQNTYTVNGLILANSINEHNPYQVEAIIYQREYYTQVGQLDKAIEKAKDVIEKNPLKIEHVESYSNLLLDQAEKLLNKRQYKQAELLLREVLEQPNHVEKLAKEKFSYYNVNHIPDLIVTEQLKDNEEKAQKYINWLDASNYTR